MPQREFKCRKCKKTFSRKFCLDRHVKNACRFKLKDKTKYFECKYCGEKIQRKDNLIKHINSNICRHTEHAEPEETSPLKIVSFSKDGIDNISRDDLHKILDKNGCIFEKIVTYVNLNPLKPEHHNIYFRDINSGYAEIYKRNRWITIKVNEALDILIDAKINDFKEILDTYDVRKKTFERVQKAIKDVDYMVYNARKKLRSFLKLILVENRKVVSRTKKILKKTQ